eukprot:TRINITY_DN1696_c0_g2_i3.p1 TRINITY_DN1696_c0_g2~~TRINITY_DN1696_c0_g2_i3.p1  ORF type:complete len:157 (-),score=4.27 TRINITY_DN1696_c0_g2_i3:86-556(-)
MTATEESSTRLGAARRQHSRHQQSARSRASSERHHRHGGQIIFKLFIRSLEWGRAHKLHTRTAALALRQLMFSNHLVVFSRGEQSHLFAQRITRQALFDEVTHFDLNIAPFHVAMGESVGIWSIPATLGSIMEPSQVALGTFTGCSWKFLPRSGKF